MRTSSHTEETMQKYKKWTASLAVTGVALSPVAVKPPTSGGGYKATYTVVKST